MGRLLPGPVPGAVQLGVLLGLVLLVSGCADEPPPPRSSEGVSTQASGAPCVPRPELVADPQPSLPVRLPPGAVLTDVTQQGGSRLITGRVGTPVEEVLEHFREDPAYVVTRDEDEGRAGRLQLFGPQGEVSVTVALLTCPRGLTGFTIAEAVSQSSPPG